MIIDCSVSLGPNCSVTSHVGLKLSHSLGREHLKLIFSHPISQAPVIVLLDPLYILRVRCDLQRCHRLPRKTSLLCVFLPHSIGCLSRPCENSSLHRVQVEGTVNYPRVSARSVNRDILFLLKNRYSALILVCNPEGN